MRLQPLQECAEPGRRVGPRVAGQLQQDGGELRRVVQVLEPRLQVGVGDRAGRDRELEVDGEQLGRAHPQVAAPLLLGIRADLAHAQHVGHAREQPHDQEVDRLAVVRVDPLAPALVELLGDLQHAGLGPPRLGRQQERVPALADALVGDRREQPQRLQGDEVDRVDLAVDGG